MELFLSRIGHKGKHSKLPNTSIAVKTRKGNNLLWNVLVETLKVRII